MWGQRGALWRMFAGVACSGGLLLLNSCGYTRNAGMRALRMDVCCLGYAVCSCGRRGPRRWRVLWRLPVDGLMICRAAARAVAAALAFVATSLLHARFGGLTLAEARVGLIICSRDTERL